MNIVQRFLISNATNQPLSETGDVAAAPVFEVVADDGKKKWAAFALGVLVAGGGAFLLYKLTDNERSRTRRHEVDTAYQSGRAHRRNFGSD